MCLYEAHAVSGLSFTLVHATVLFEGAWWAAHYPTHHAPPRISMQRRLGRSVWLSFPATHWPASQHKRNVDWPRESGEGGVSRAC